MRLAASLACYRPAIGDFVYASSCLICPFDIIRHKTLFVGERGSSLNESLFIIMLPILKWVSVDLMSDKMRKP